MNPIVILDNGHGKETAGKRSPVWADGSQLFEYEFNRDIVRRIAEKLEAENIPYRILVPEENDIGLSERARRANAIAKENGGKAYVLSIHANAGGGTGWEVWTSPGQTAADKIATVFFEEAGREFTPLAYACGLFRRRPGQRGEFYHIDKNDVSRNINGKLFYGYRKGLPFHYERRRA